MESTSAASRPLRPSIPPVCQCRFAGEIADFDGKDYLEKKRPQKPRLDGIGTIRLAASACPTRGSTMARSTRASSTPIASASSSAAGLIASELPELLLGCRPY